jgi:GST-like protein
MIDLYAAGTSNGMRARIALEECGLPYTFHPIDLAKGENRTPAYLALNPVGEIPVIVDPDGPGGKKITLSQSLAIMVYCAEKTGKFIPVDPALRPAFSQAFMSAATDMGPMLGTIFGIARSKDPHQPTLEMFQGRWKNYLKVWDETLGRQRFAAGKEVTIADFGLYGTVARAKNVLPGICEGVPNVDRWLGEIGARPAVQRAMKF